MCVTAIVIFVGYVRKGRRDNMCSLHLHGRVCHITNLIYASIYRMAGSVKHVHT